MLEYIVMSNDVFEVIGDKVTINNFNKAIPEFRSLTTMEDILYVYHMGSYKSPYSNYDKEERKTKVMKDFCQDIVINPFHQIAIDKYIELQQTPSMRFLDANKKGMRKLENFLETVDLNERNDKGMPVYKPYDITSAMEKSGKIIESIQVLEEKVKKELQVNGDKVRGDYKVNKWEK